MTDPLTACVKAKEPHKILNHLLTPFPYYLTASTLSTVINQIVCLQNSSQVVSSTAPPFRKIPQAAKQQILIRDKHVGFLHFNINKRLCFSAFTHSLLCFYPKLTSRKVASYSNNSNFICTLDLHLSGCTRQE